MDLHTAEKFSRLGQSRCTLPGGEGKCEGEEGEWRNGRGCRGSMEGKGEERIGWEPGNIA